MVQEVEVPDGVTVSAENNLVTTKGKKGEVTRNLPSKKITINVNEGKIVLEAKNATKREKTMMGSYKAHIGNMLRGCEDGHSYSLKIASVHFPMNVSVANNQLVVKNFLGEKVPRVLDLISGVTVKVEGDIVMVEGVMLEDVSQTAASIEQLTRITNRDNRIFQDGIYITDKDGDLIEQ
jgi:large subunit ribosomal protein L6